MTQKYTYTLNLDTQHFCYRYRKDTEPLYHSFMYGIYPSPEMHLLLVTI